MTRVNVLPFVEPPLDTSSRRTGIELVWRFFMKPIH